jgi:hypothetical protein
MRLERKQQIMMEEIRFPYHSPHADFLLDVLDLAKWPARKIWGENRHRLPTLLKRRVIASYARRYKLGTFVESGTYLGGTVAFMRRYCGQVYSVEFQPHLAKAAQERFARDRSIRIFHGDGSQWMPRIIAELREPALFWLDGHFEPGTARDGELACPTWQEMSAALADARFSHILLVDDARDFNGRGGYPTLEALEQFIHSVRADVALEVRHDILRVTPKQTGKTRGRANPS